MSYSNNSLRKTSTDWNMYFTHITFLQIPLSIQQNILRSIKNKYNKISRQYNILSLWLLHIWLSVSWYSICSSYFKILYFQIKWLGPIYLHGLNWIPAWISNNIYNKECYEITYPFPKFYVSAVEVFEWICDLIPRFSRTCDYLSMLGLNSMLVEGAPCVQTDETILLSLKSWHFFACWAPLNYYFTSSLQLICLVTLRLNIVVQVQRIVDFVFFLKFHVLPWISFW